MRQVLVKGATKAEGHEHVYRLLSVQERKFKELATADNPLSGHGGRVTVRLLCICLPLWTVRFTLKQKVLLAPWNVFDPFVLVYA